MSVPRPPRPGRGPGERDVTTSIRIDPERGEGVNLDKATEPTGPWSATPALGKGRRATPGERTPDTHGTEPTGWGCRDRPGCPQRGAHAQADRSPPALAFPRHTRVGQRRPGPRAAPGSRDTQTEAWEVRHAGPSRRLNREQGRLARSPLDQRSPTQPEARPLQRRVARGQRVSNNPVARNDNSE